MLDKGDSPGIVSTERTHDERLKIKALCIASLEITGVLGVFDRV